VLHVVAESPTSFLLHLKEITFIERKPLRYLDVLLLYNFILHFLIFILLLLLLLLLSLLLLLFIIIHYYSSLLMCNIIS